MNVITPTSIPNHLPKEWQVPDADVYELAARRSTYCICIPVINEGERIRRQLCSIAAWNLRIDVVIADGGSTDGSVALETLNQLSVRTLLVKTGSGRLSAQLRVGLAYALTQGYKGIITIDGNGKDGVDAIPKFAEALDAGYDHVQGSRYITGGNSINTPVDRYYAGKYLHAPLISLAAGFRYTDTTNGFRAYSRQFLLDTHVQPFRDIFHDYNLHYYLAIRAARLGFRVIELPVTRIYPKAGPTPSKISGWQGRLRILSQLVASAMGMYNP